jgi:hypothetical protein
MRNIEMLINSKHAIITARVKKNFSLSIIKKMTAGLKKVCFYIYMLFISLLLSLE